MDIPAPIEIDDPRFVFGTWTVIPWTIIPDDPLPQIGFVGVKFFIDGHERGLIYEYPESIVPEQAVHLLRLHVTDLMPDVLRHIAANEPMQWKQLAHNTLKFRADLC